MSVLEMSSRHGMIRRGQKSAVAAVCYITASAGMDERTGQSFDYGAKGQVTDVQVILPEGLLSWMRDPVKLMAAAELYEDVWAERRFKTPLFQERHKASAMVAHTAHYSLHNALRDDPEAIWSVIHDFVRDRYTAYGVGVVVAVHDETHNLHFHVQSTKRVLENSLEGFGRKAACFTSPAVLSVWAKENRATLAKLQNQTLERLGIDSVVEHRSFHDREIELDATLHHGELGEALIARGDQPHVFLENTDIKRRNEERILDNPGLILTYINASKATFTYQNIAYEVTRRMEGQEELIDHVLDQVMRHEELITLPSLGDEEGRYTTKTYQDHENRMFDVASRMHGQEVQMNPLSDLSLDGLNESQKEAAHALSSSSRLVLLQGAAGVGKTTLLRPVARYLEGQGYRVRGLALAGVAVEGLRESLGCEARTIASFLKREEMKELGKLQPSSMDLSSRDVVILDEAGMVDVPTLSKVLSIIEQSGAMVRLVGDPEQLKAIGAGDAFRGLLNRLGGPVLQDVVRQKSAIDREAVSMMSRGFMDQGLGLIRDRTLWFDTDETLLDAMVQSYMDDHMQHASGGLMLAFLRRDVKVLNDKTRTLMREKGLIQSERSFLPKYSSNSATASGLTHDRRSLGIGDIIIFLEKNNDLGVVNGTRGYVIGFDEEGLIRVKTEQGRDVQWHPETFKAWDYAYAMTVHKSQGVTIRQAWMKADQMLGSEGHYVGLSRHQEHVTLMVSKASFASEPDLIKALTRGGQKDLIQDRVSSSSQETYIEEALSRYKILSHERFDRTLPEDQRMRATSDLRDIAEDFVRTWGDALVSSRARLQGLSLRTLEYQAGLRLRPNTSLEQAFEERIHHYQELASHAGSLWKTIRKTHPGAKCWSHPDYETFREVQVKRDSIASEIMSKVSDHQTFIALNRVSRKALLSQSKAHIQREEMKSQQHELKLQEQERMHQKTLEEQRIQKDVETEKAAKRAQALSLFNQSKSIKGTVAERYLRDHRDIKTADLPEDTVRFLPKGAKFDTKFLSRNVSKHPSLLVVGRDASGEISCVQITNLDAKTAQKADIPVSRKTYGVLSGSSVCLQKGVATEGQSHPIMIAEGVETALSLVECKMQGTIYSVLGIQNLKHVASVLEVHMKDHDRTQTPIILAADQDGSPDAPSHKIVADVAQTLHAQGMKVEITRPKSHPQHVKCDWNDILKTYGPRSLPSMFVKGKETVKALEKTNDQEIAQAQEDQGLREASQSKDKTIHTHLSRYVFFDLKELNTRLHKTMREVAPRLITSPLDSKESTRTQLVFKDATQKISLCLEGSKAGLWYDFKRGVGGTMIDLIQDQKHMSKHEAIVHAANLVGLQPERVERTPSRSLTRVLPHQEVRKAYLAQMPSHMHRFEAQREASVAEEKKLIHSMFERLQENPQGMTKGYLRAFLHLARTQTRLEKDADVAGQKLSREESLDQATQFIWKTQEHVPAFQKELEDQGFKPELVNDGRSAFVGHLQRYGQMPTSVQKEHIMRVVEAIQPMKEHLHIPKGFEDAKDALWALCVDRVLLNTRDGRAISPESIQKTFQFVSKQFQNNLKVVNKQIERDRAQAMQKEQAINRSRDRGFGLEM